jgi:hypothetical protein
MVIPRSEYPRPQFVRSDWLCLNGESIEQNGLYTFDRRAKFDLERLRQIQSRPAAIERL